MSDNGNERIRMVHDLIPSDWDVAPMSIAHELRRLLSTVVDQGTDIDSGGGNGRADLWVTIQGREFVISVVPTRGMSDV